MRLILWIAIFVSTLAGAGYGHYKFRQNRLIAHPAYIEEFAHEAKQYAPLPAAVDEPNAMNLENDAECEQLRHIDWEGILSNHTFLNGLPREEIKADTIWTLHLSLLAFLGMEYEFFEIERLDAESLTYRRVEFSDFSEPVVQPETRAFDQFRQQVCGVHRVRPLVYLESALGQVALPLPDGFTERFMNQAEFRRLLGQRIKKHFRVDINQSSWTVEDFLDLLEQP